MSDKFALIFEMFLPLEELPLGIPEVPTIIQLAEIILCKQHCVKALQATLDFIQSSLIYPKRTASGIL